MNAQKGQARNVVLRLDRITKRFGDLTANDAISLTLRRGEVVALLGENGAGKTTLMNILFGHYVADEGSVEVFGEALPPGQPRAALAAGVGMVHQHFTLADNLSVLDNIRLGTEPLFSIGKGTSTARREIAFLSREFGLAIDLDAKVGRLTVGERQRVEILKALYRQARILILDEPTAVLTPQEADALFATLRLATEHGLSILFISHKLHEVMAIANRAVVLRHGKVVGETAIAKTTGQQLAAMMVGGEVTLPKADPPKAGPVLLRLDRVSTAANGVAPGLKDVSFELRSGVITGLAGVSGNGQAALADLISGLLAPKSGRMDIGGAIKGRWTPRKAIRRGIARIPEDRHKTGTIAGFNLTENAVLEGYYKRDFSRIGLVDWRAARKFAQEIIRTYDVRGADANAPIRLLSGGNMQKLILGRVLEPGPTIIVANQPVRGLDVGAIAYVQSRLIAARNAGAAVLLISEDLDEIMGLADEIHVISEGRLSPAFPRGTKTPAELGLWMAGSGFDAEVNHAS